MKKDRSVHHEIHGSKLNRISKDVMNLKTIIVTNFLSTSDYLIVNFEYVGF